MQIESFVRFITQEVAVLEVVGVLCLIHYIRLVLS